jgi:hypothetical protein
VILFSKCQVTETDDGIFTIWIIRTVVLVHDNFGSWFKVKGNLWLMVQGEWFRVNGEWFRVQI